METPVKQSCSRTFSRAIVMLLMIIGTTTGCAALKTGQSEAGKRIIWQSHEQFVAIERQDHPAGITVPANDHPADLSTERLRNALGSVDVQFQDNNTVVQLFNDPELDILSEKIGEGLAQARPDEDVTFAVVGQQSVLMGLMKSRVITVGRVFCLDGKLNIIFGDLLRDIKENEDRRLFPFIEGSRGTAGTGTWSLTTKPGGEPFSLMRRNWIQFPLAYTPAAVTVPTPSVAPSAAPSSSGRGVGSSTLTEPAAPAIRVAPVGRSLEERLRTLDDLYRKNLITNDEYRAKRKEILEGL